MKTDPFKLVCFCVLMDHHREGVEKAHPYYMLEKFDDIMKREPLSALSLLDAENQRRVFDWCKNWKIEIPTHG